LACRSGLRRWLAGSPSDSAESRSSSYGPTVHLRLLPTLPRGNAVTFSYRPESVCLKGTFTPQIECTLRRTSPAFQRWVASVACLSGEGDPCFWRPQPHSVVPTGLPLFLVASIPAMNRWANVAPCLRHRQPAVLSTQNWGGRGSRRAGSAGLPSPAVAGFAKAGASPSRQAPGPGPLAELSAL